MNQAVETQARQAYEKAQDELLALTPLGRMAEWITAGRAPPAAALRSINFRRDCPDQALAPKLRLARKAYIRRYGFSIPCAEALQALHSLGPLVEIGAGTGYWSAMLTAGGANVAATDPFVGQEAYRFVVGAAAEMEALTGVAAVERYPERAVFCSWPSENEGWATEAAQRTTRGVHFALIGEPRGGCTGSAGLFDLLDAEFVHDCSVEIPQFPGINDRLDIYRRI